MIDFMVINVFLDISTILYLGDFKKGGEKGEEGTPSPVYAVILVDTHEKR